ncbi:hypothetical protein DsansV1_C09g0091301 [Dioscorea sansibarensis]
MLALFSQFLLSSRPFKRTCVIFASTHLCIIGHGLARGPPFLFGMLTHESSAIKCNILASITTTAWANHCSCFHFKCRGNRLLTCCLM